MCLPREVSHAALERRVRSELAEGRVINPDRMGEVSRRHSSRRKRAAVEYPRRTHLGEGLNGACAE